MPKMKKILITMGSQSDWPIMCAAEKLLTRFDVAFETRVVSAHRTPERIDDIATLLAAEEYVAVLAGAGGAAHLAGAIAARTIIPVIGVPMSSKLHGLDSLLSTVQMPAGIPVATVSVGEPGAKNAALLALQIAALEDHVVAQQLLDYRRSLAGAVPFSPTRVEAAE